MRQAKHECHDKVKPGMNQVTGLRQNEKVRKSQKVTGHPFTDKEDEALSLNNIGQDNVRYKTVETDTRVDAKMVIIGLWHRLSLIF